MITKPYDTWREMLANLTNNDLVNVFKGLVILERDLKWIGGSAAGAIWVYDVIRQRELDKDYLIADYGFSNCDNPYIPFGSSYYGNRTAKDYLAHRAEKARVKEDKASHYENVLKRAMGRKEKRIAAIAELRRLTKEERGHVTRFSGSPFKNVVSVQN